MAAAARPLWPGFVYAVPGGAWVADEEVPVLAFVRRGDLSAEVVGSWFDACPARDWAPIDERHSYTKMAGDDSECWIAWPAALGVVRVWRGGWSAYRLPAPVVVLACAAGACWMLVEEGEPSGSVWLVDQAGARPFDCDLVISHLAGWRGQMFAIAHDHGDFGDDASPVNRLVLLRLSASGGYQVAGRFEVPRDAGVRLHAGAAGLWLERWYFCDFPTDEHWIQPIEPTVAGVRLGDLVPMPPHADDFLLDDQDMTWTLTWAGARSPWAAEDGDFDHPCGLIRRPATGGGDNLLLLPGMTIEGSASGGQAWVPSEHRLPLPHNQPRFSLLRISADADRTLSLAQLTRWPDLAGLIPPPQPPAGADPDALAEFQRQEIEDTLVGRDIDEETWPFHDRVMVDSVTRHGTYPGTEIVIRFRLGDQPTTRFGHRLRCFDSTGVPLLGGITSSWIFEVGGMDIPPPGRAFPDASGTVWV